MMYTRKSAGSMMKEMIKDLCCSYGWSYGVLWGFHPTISSLLTLQEAYHEQQMRPLLEDKLLQVHVVGRGVIGQAAFRKEHQWMFLDTHMGTESPAGSAGACNEFQDLSGLERQLSLGIKTVAVISVDLIGVVEFGSTQKIPERVDFVTRTKEVFNGIRTIEESVTTESQNSFSKIDTCGTSGLFSSLISGDDWYPRTPNLHCAVLAKDLTETRCCLEETICSFAASTDRENMEHNVNASSECNNSFGTTKERGQLDADYNRATIQSYELLSRSDTFSEFSSQNPQNSNWGSANEQESPCPNSRCRSGSYAGTLETVEETTRTQISSSSFHSYHGQTNSPFKPSANYCSTDGFLQWSPHTIDQLKKTQTCEPVALTRLRECQPSISAQSSITNIVKCKGNKKFRMDKQWSESTDDCTETVMPFYSGENFNFCASAAECISELHAGPNQGTINTALSSTAKRRKLESSSPSNNQVEYVHGFAGHGNPLQSVNVYQNRTNTLEFRNEGARMLEPCMYSGNSCSNVSGDSISANITLEQAVKTVNQNAKPGTKPRPKERQQIHERLLQLRKLIPDGEKMSIDSLLHQTIKHLLFLQSVTNHAENSQKNNKAEHRMIRKENPSSSNGITWACEVGYETMFCPLIVEDLSVPGQMLIEVLCEEQDFFLEMVDIIRGLGLTIMKGVMEMRENNIWAQFTVEAEEGNGVTRHEVFYSLLQLLQLTEPTEVDKHARVKRHSIARGGAAVGRTCQQSKVAQVLL